VANLAARYSPSRSVTASLCSSHAYPASSWSARPGPGFAVALRAFRKSRCVGQGPARSYRSAQRQPKRRLHRSQRPELLLPTGTGSARPGYRRASRRCCSRTPASVSLAAHEVPACRPSCRLTVDLPDARNRRDATVSDPATWFGAGRSRRLCVRHLDGFRSVFLPSHEPGFADGLPGARRTARGAIAACWPRSCTC
jgi:hypothetical protein